MIESIKEMIDEFSSDIYKAWHEDKGEFFDLIFMAIMMTMVTLLCVAFVIFLLVLIITKAPLLGLGIFLGASLFAFILRRLYIHGKRMKEEIND